jgi:PUB domain
MGYAGYVSAKLPPPKPTEVQAALWNITSLDSLELLVKLIQNIAINPGESLHLHVATLAGRSSSLNNRFKFNFWFCHAGEPKFKRIKLSNPKIKSSLVDTPGGLDALLALGWVYDEEDRDCLVVPKGRQFTMTEVQPHDSSTLQLN